MVVRHAEQSDQVPIGAIRDVYLSRQVMLLAGTSTRQRGAAISTTAVEALHVSHFRSTSRSSSPAFPASSSAPAHIPGRMPVLLVAMTTRT